MCFAMSYSCGKDSTFALHKMLSYGHEPICLLTMFNREQERSWFHGADEAMLKAYGAALDIPLLFFPASGAQYAEAFGHALVEARALGAEVCAFGDLDFDQNRAWEEARCEEYGLGACFPLWNMRREEIIDGLLNVGYRCLIKTINKQKFPHVDPDEIERLCEKYLGSFLDWNFLRDISRLGGDICGENGEYHTLVTDGPIFHHPLVFRLGKIIQLPGHAVIETMLT